MSKVYFEACGNDHVLTVNYKAYANVQLRPMTMILQLSDFETNKITAPPSWDGGILITPISPIRNQTKRQQKDNKKRKQEEKGKRTGKKEGKVNACGVRRA